jgi:hypothetical protein
MLRILLHLYRVDRLPCLQSWPLSWHSDFMLLRAADLCLLLLWPISKLLHYLLLPAQGKSRDDWCRICLLVLWVRWWDLIVGDVLILIEVTLSFPPSWVRWRQLWLKEFQVSSLEVLREDKSCRVVDQRMHRNPHRSLIVKEAVLTVLVRVWFVGPDALSSRWWAWYAKKPIV